MFGRKSKKIAKLLNQISEQQKKIQSLESVLQKKANASEWYHSKAEEKKALQRRHNLELLQNKNNIDQNLSTYYQKKSHCMSSNESCFFYYLQSFTELHPDAFFGNKKLKVFPQVSLHSFINITDTAKGTDAEIYSYILSNFLSKNVDYLICEDVRDPVTKHHSYVPYFAVELDGNSHKKSVNDAALSPERRADAFARTQRSDAFKDALYKAVGIPLIRYQLSNDNKIHQSDENGIRKLTINKLSGLCKAS
ncbi:MAG: DUF2726 domain-containing protein [Oscillospiraceae bacterium]|nr:DUF2726 domain-containing protein [Oscillospiraceae bacterium]